MLSSPMTLVWLLILAGLVSLMVLNALALITIHNLKVRDGVIISRYLAR